MFFGQKKNFYLLALDLGEENQVAIQSIKWVVKLQTPMIDYLCKIFEIQL